MVSWPAGHRWEDCQVTVYAKDLSWSATLGSAKRLRYNKRLYGGYGAMLTFELRRDDPWVAALTDGQLHWIKVLEDKGDGTRWQTFAGFQIKRKDGDALGEDEQYIEFTFLPMPRMAFWRVGIPVTGETLEVTDKVDDAFKWIIERTLGATAPVAPTTSAVRAFTDFSVAADKSEYPDNVELKATGQNIYEFLQLHGAAYGVDWDIYFDANDHPEFETWYPRRGLDRTEGNGVNTECIFTDAQGSFKKQEYQYDTADVVSNVLDNRFTKDVGDTDVSDNWLYRETAVPSANEVTMAVELADRTPKRSWTMSDFVESEARQWGLHFDVGDKVTVYSTEFGYTMEDTICDVTVEYDDAGFRVLTLTFGDPTPDNQDNSRGGGRRRLDPEYTDPRQIPDMALTILPVANTNVVGVGTRAAPDDHQHLLSLTADDAGVMTLTAGVGNVIGAGGVATSIVDGDLVISGAGVLNAHALLSATHNDTTAASVVRGDLVTGQGAAPNTKWARLAIGAAYTFPMSDGTDLAYHAAVIAVAGDVGDGATPDAVGAVTFGGSAGYSFDAHDNQVDFTGPWTRDDGNGYLYPTTLTDHVLIGRNDQVGAHGLGTTYLDVGGDVRVNKYVYATANGLTLYGASGVVDIYNNSSACTLNIYNGAAKNIMLDSNGSSYFRGGGVHVENSHSLTLYSDAGVTTTASWAATDGSLTIAGGGDITVQSGGNTKWSLDGATGNTTWVSTATTTLGGYTYTWPTSGAATGEALVATVSGANITLSWEAPAAAAHNLFSATHGDTTGAADPVDGDIIIGNATPKWSKLAISAPAANVRNVLGVDNGETRPSWKTALDGTNPATLTAAAAAAPGTSLVFAHRDHVHPITTTTSGAASTIVATNADGYITAVRFVFDASEYISTSGGTIAYNASNFHRFYINTTQHLIVQDGYVFPGVTNNTQLGQSSYRWSNVYSVLGNYSGQITSSLATGTAPLAVTSTTVCTNLNADYLDGYNSSMASDVNTVAVRNASGNLYANAFYDGVYYCKPNGSSTFNGGLNLNGTIQADGIRIDITPTIKTSAVVTRTIPIDCNGTTRYMMLADEA